jgi:hypothetical protein
MGALIAAIPAFFTALANIKSIAGYLDQFAGAVMLWYVQRQGTETLSQISDAAALSARAQSDQDRYAAAQAWQTALSRPRVTS